MQKVVGSNPIIRSDESPATQRFSVAETVTRVASHAYVLRTSESRRRLKTCDSSAIAACRRAPFVEVAVAIEDERAAVPAEGSPNSSAPTNARLELPLHGPVFRATSRPCPARWLAQPPVDSEQ